MKKVTKLDNKYFIQKHRIMKSNQKRNTLPFFKTATLWVALAMPMLVCAQIRIDWQQCYGSMGPDYGFSILPTNQGFAVLGQVEEDSPSGMYECNIYAPYRADWLIGIDTGISPDWQNCFSVGLYQKLCKAGDDTYYIAGLGLDYYYNYNLRVIQTDELGNILWIKYLGTAHGLDNCANNVFGSSTPDGGIIVATTIDEASGDVSQHFGGNDCWVVKLDTEGNIVWQTTLGTEGDDMVTCLQEAADGGLLLWINSDQTGNGNIGCGQPENKGVLVKIDALGQIQWNLCFERTSVVSIVEMEDGYLLAGSQRYTVEPNGNCGDGIYTYDCYLMKCDIEGNVIWDKEFGGSCNDKMVKVLHNSIDNGFTAFTNSKSTDGDVESFVNLGVTGADDGNIWMFHVNAEGELLWECCIGSQLGLWEEMRDVVALNDKEYAIVGTNTWFDGVSSGLVECSNNLLLPNSGSNIWALRVTDVYDYEQGEIIYRDFEPDSILIYWHKLGPVWIDLDADGEANDLKMQMWVAGEICAPELITAGSNIRICTVEPYCVLSEVAEEDWKTYIGWSGGCVPCANDHYGFRIQREDGYYYGWFETYNRVISAKNERQIAHFGFDRTAYCTIPNYPLRWGQTEIETTTPIVPDLYTIGYKDENSTTRTAMLFKNNELLHSISVAGKQITPYKIACDTQGNLYWMVVYSENNSTLQTEIRKNDELFLSTEGHYGVSVNDIYCLGDTLFYVGNSTNEGKTVATVWRGPDFTPHWILGDGMYNSVIKDADVDESTNIPYFCGYVTEGLNKATVWKASQRLFTHEPFQYANYTECNSQAQEISVNNGVIYTKGHFFLYYVSSEHEYHPCIWNISENGTTNWMAQPSESINALCTFENNSYFCDNYPEEERYSICRNRSSHEVLSFPYPFENETTICNIRCGFNDVYMVGKWNGQGCIWKNFQLLSPCDNCDVITDIAVVSTLAIIGSEWYYEIQNNDGSITYQHLECVGDTLFDRAGKRPKVIVRSNTHYDRDTITEVTHEYIYEEYGTVYWWNRDLQEFTTLYNLAANVGDEWEIKVGNETITMHVDTIENIEYEGHTYRTLHVSDPDDLFSGDIVCGFGHMTSFFPEQLMNRGKDFTVNGLRCYWIGDELIYHNGEEDCDAIHSELQSLDETDDAAFTVYPNPATGLVQIEGVGCAEVQVYNALGQIVKAAQNANEVSLVGLPQGVYLLRVTLKDGKVFSEKVVKE